MVSQKIVPKKMESSAGRIVDISSDDDSDTEATEAPPPAKRKWTDLKEEKGRHAVEMSESKTQLEAAPHQSPLEARIAALERDVAGLRRQVTQLQRASRPQPVEQVGPPYYVGYDNIEGEERDPKKPVYEREPCTGSRRPMVMVEGRKYWYKGAILKHPFGSRYKCAKYHHCKCPATINIVDGTHEVIPIAGPHTCHGPDCRCMGVYPPIE